MDYTELIKRLRNAESNSQDTLDCLSEAADAIEELQTGIKEMAAAGQFLLKVHELDCQYPTMRWISVTERLPEKDGDYLVWFRPDEEVADPYYALYSFDANVPAFGYWKEDYNPETYGWAGSDFIRIEEITHWMPLPEPPKEET